MNTVASLLLLAQPYCMQYFLKAGGNCVIAEEN